MSLDQAPPPDDTSPGYKPDPLGSKNTRRWDGTQWTQEILPPEKTGLSAKWSGLSSGKKWLFGIIAGFLVLAALGAIIGEEEPEPTKEKPAVTEADKSAGNEKAQEKPAESAKPEKAAEKPKPVDPAEEIKTALDGVSAMDDVNVKDVYMIGNTVTVELETPEGGLEGPSSFDMNDQVANVYRRIFTETEKPRTIYIDFSGGLINMKTGEESSDVPTGSYKISANEARQIDWEDEDKVLYGIDWSLYRLSLHPAIKKDDA